MLGSKIIIDNKNCYPNNLGYKNFRSWKILKNGKLWVQNLFEPVRIGAKLIWFEQGCEV